MSISNAERQKLRTEAQQLAVTVQVGKLGINEASVQELQRQLRAHRLVKVRLLPSATDGGANEGTQAEALAAAVGAELVERRGYTVVLWRSRGSA